AYTNRYIFVIIFNDVARTTPVRPGLNATPPSLPLCLPPPPAAAPPQPASLQRTARLSPGGDADPGPSADGDPGLRRRVGRQPAGGRRPLRDRPQSGHADFRSSWHPD